MGSKEHHPALSSLAWLFGEWESVEAEVCYPHMDRLKYTEVLEFKPAVDHPVLEYRSDTVDPAKDCEMHCEKGYLRLDPETEKLSLVIAHNLGLTELSLGSMDNDAVHFESKILTPVPLSCVEPTRKLVRKWYKEGDDLCSTVFMETSKQPLQLHLQCRYKKKD